MLQTEQTEHQPKRELTLYTIEVAGRPTWAQPYASIQDAEEEAANEVFRVIVLLDADPPYWDEIEPITARRATEAEIAFYEKECAELYRRCPKEERRDNRGMYLPGYLTDQNE